MKNKTKLSAYGLTAIAIAALLTLAACGGGGGSGSPSTSGTPSAGSAGSTSTSTPVAVTGTLTTPQYAANSAQLAAFNLLNQYRQECGFPALQENTLLDQAAQAHAQYEQLNGAISDNEVSGNPGFTGITQYTRAQHFGFPSAVLAGGGGNTGYYTNATLTDTQYGQQLVNGLLSGVYHSATMMYPANLAGIGELATQYNGYPEIWSSFVLISPAASTISSAPVTFPCQGVTGVAYSAGGETPTPPSTSGNWGTPVLVMGNPTDTIVLQSATMTGAAGNVSLYLLSSTNDPSKLIGAYEAVAYPTSPLSPNTQYSVSLTGTVNGTAFSRSFTFTTGNVVG